MFGMSTDWTIFWLVVSIIYGVLLSYYVGK